MCHCTCRRFRQAQSSIVAFDSSRCISGIWIGDIGLYGLARLGGRGGSGTVGSKVCIIAGPGSARRTGLHVTDRQRCRQRFIPGTRLPTYLAAVSCACRCVRFASITGLCAAVCRPHLFDRAMVKTMAPQGVPPFARSVCRSWYLQRSRSSYSD